jgi:hypothetical protein
MNTTHHLLQTDVEQIKNEITQAVKTVITGCETLDIERAFQVFWDSPDFRMISMDGGLCDYQTYVQNNLECSNI